MKDVCKEGWRKVEGSSKCRQGRRGWCLNSTYIEVPECLHPKTLLALLSQPDSITNALVLCCGVHCRNLRGMGRLELRREDWAQSRSFYAGILYG